MDFSYVLHKLIDPHLEVPKHFLVPLPKSLSCCGLFFIKLDKCWTMFLFIPSFFYYRIATVVSYPNSFKPERSMGEAVFWIGVKQDRGMVGLDGSQMGHSSFWEG